MSVVHRLLARIAIESRRGRLILTAAAIGAYVAALVLVAQFAGTSAAVLVVLPVILVAWLFGRSGGILAALLLPLPTVAVIAMAGVDSWGELLRSGGIRLVVLLAIGLVVGQLRELTWKLRQQEAALAVSERRLSALLQHAADGIAIVDAAGTISYQSPAVARIFGLTPEDLQGTNAFARAHPGDLAIAQRGFSVLAGRPGATDDGTLRVRHADGSWRVLEVRATNLLADPDIRGIVLNYRDISERLAAEEAVWQSAESFASLFDAAGEGLVIHEGGPILVANRAYAAMMGYEVEEVVGRNGLDFIAPAMRALSERLSRAGDERPYEAALIHRDGRHIPMELAGKAIRYQGRPARLVTLRDITARQAAEAALRASEAGLAEAQRIAQLGSWSWEIATDRVTWSAELSRIFGHTPGQAAAAFADYLARVHPDDRDRARAVVQAARREEGQFDSEHRIVRPDGEVRTLHSRGVTVRDAAGRAIGMLGTCHDITERTALEARLAHQATHDPLTGLPNRALFLDRLEQAVARSHRSSPHGEDGSPCAVLFLDLDRFKDVNDSLGHAAGDRLLVAVAERLRAALRAGDTLARLGGDEFALLLEGVADLGEALRVAARLHEALATPLVVDGREIFAGASIGVALRASDEDGPEALLRYADVALYRAKGAGRSCVEAFHPGMNAESLARLELEHDLRRALERGELRLHYQPKVDLATGTITAIEALARWQHPTRGLVPPGDFIPLAEETGLIVPIGRWVLNEGCRQMRDWQARYPDRRAPILAVNLSARQFRHPDLMDDIAATLAAAGLAPARLRLEVTETVAMERAELGIATLERLRALGVSVAIDDFGTGYSSLAYLQRLPVDTLKIDRSFFREGDRNRAIVGAVADLAHGLGLIVIAEGLETAEQVALAREVGCDRGQGHYFARALPPEELEAWWAAGLVFALPYDTPSPDIGTRAPAQHPNGDAVAAIDAATILAGGRREQPVTARSLSPSHRSRSPRPSH